MIQSINDPSSPAQNNKQTFGVIERLQAENHKSQLLVEQKQKIKATKSTL